MTGHSGNVLSVASSPDGKRVVSGSADNFVKIWDIATGAEVNSFLSVLRGGVVRGLGACFVQELISVRGFLGRCAL